ncbi:MAG: DNA topoisomerase (ATP-hydrolyzing) [Phycisphaerae bacterium]|nr:MAG: DNA topoisomerase (ATP-hydrolyzing) [Phycisphaerae bacterium]
MADTTADSPQEHIVNQSLIEEMKGSYLTYSMSVIMARALPDARDGLKPSQRRILVAMNDLNLGPRSAFRKCAKISGDTSGNYHPHGDQVIYPTMVRLGQPWNLSQVLIDKQGNWGSIDGDPPAAMRYTEARLHGAAMELLSDLEFETVDVEPNFDNTRTEPTVLPSKFPNLLVNGGSGIAVGMATNMAPHNVGEVCNAIIGVIDNPNITIAELLEIIPGPDFPTGGEICGRRGILDAFMHGKGQVMVRGKVDVEEGRGGKETIVISEVPYQVLRSSITERAAAAVKGGLIKDVATINDASDRKHEIRIEIELRKGANADVVINQLYQYTPLQSNFNISNVALVDRKPQSLTLRRMIDVYIRHRRDVIRRRTQFLLQRAKQKAHIHEALILAIGDIDGIIETIKKSPDSATAKERLMERPLSLTEGETLRNLLPASFVERFGDASNPHYLTAVQAQAILVMQLQKLTGLEIEKLAGEYTKLVEQIADYEGILSDDALVLDIIREDLYEIRDKFGVPRRTTITEAVGDFSVEELIPDEQVVVTISHEGYIKRTDTDSYRKQGRGGRGVRGGNTKDGDFIEHLFVVNTHDYMLFFTNRGRVYWARVFDIPAGARTARGRSIANLVNMQDGEEHRAVLPVKEFEEKFVFFATAEGKVKKTALGAFSRPRSNGIIAIVLNPSDALIGVEMTDGDHEIVLASRGGMAVRFKEDDVRVMGRSAAGVRGMALGKDDCVVGMIAIRPGASVLTVCENGFGKRTNIDEYRLTKRGGKGVINIKVTDRNGQVVAMKAVNDKDELMFITQNGIMLRTDLDEVREIGRATQGVRLIKTNEDDKVVAVARIVPEEDKAEGGDSEESGSDSAAETDPEA